MIASMPASSARADEVNRATITNRKRRDRSCPGPAKNHPASFGRAHMMTASSTSRLGMSVSQNCGSRSPS